MTYLPFYSESVSARLTATVFMLSLPANCSRPQDGAVTTKRPVNSGELNKSNCWSG